ncbi:TonB-dependent receptor [Pseudorhodoferax sp. Leaf265]|uniref:TonB-dependent receptor family protein n=1 Tax=Pseudorhodoferax sp. Leaf265 TaxID=1736315 RepID=UPI001F30AE77|nr:TonB-dependent receptor [Pseudorhodoferax sp. Leaf265]
MPLLVCSTTALPLSGHAQTQAPAPALAATVVTATRTEADPLAVPASVERIDGDALRLGRAQVNISEALGTVPGLQARERQNYAQDVQISMRGFGTRATFGIRGLRLYVDGIPATQPDGQGQLSHVDLASAERIEVLRGPFSALYGNSSGGVLQVFTEEGRGAPRLRLDTAAGSDGLLRFGAKVSGNTGPNDSGVGYVVSASRFSTDGYREHSEARRLLANAKLTLRPHEDGKLTLVANRVVLPKADDPLGLSRAQWQANPRGVDPAALRFDTRKNMDQTQAGLVYEHYLSEAHALQATLYGGQRGTTQFQSIPVAVQDNPRHPGGVIDLDRDYAGADLRWTWRTELADAPLSVVAGLAYDGLREDRRGYANFVGSTLGVQGALRRNERNRVNNFDKYLQADWRVTQHWTVNAGLRHSRVRFDSQDRYVVGVNPDDSGQARYGATLPVVGASFAITESLRVYASVGKGFETPTLNELSYRPDQQPGLNFGLQPARSKSVEAGLKHRSAALGEWTAAVFRTCTEDEIVTSTVNGRSTAQNAGKTRRNGLELAWEQRHLQHLRTQVAATFLDARYRDGANAGARLPGLAKSSLYASAGWVPPQGWRAGADWRALSRVMVNDANSDAAAGYGVLGLYTGYAARLGSWQLEGFVRADNLLDKRYAGSVIVNEGNSRFFEPAPGRNWLVGLSATLPL